MKKREFTSLLFFFCVWNLTFEDIEDEFFEIFVALQGWIWEINWLKITICKLKDWALKILKRNWDLSQRFFCLAILTILKFSFKILNKNLFSIFFSQFFKNKTNF